MFSQPHKHLPGSVVDPTCVFAGACFIKLYKDIADSFISSFTEIISGPMFAIKLEKPPMKTLLQLSNGSQSQAALADLASRPVSMTARAPSECR